MLKTVYHDDSVWHWIKNLCSTKERADRRSREKSGIFLWDFQIWGVGSLGLPESAS